MLLACNGFEFESTRSISAGFFFPRVLTGDRLRQADSMAETSTESNTFQPTRS
jgi:hypothetical protein